MESYAFIAHLKLIQWCSLPLDPLKPLPPVGPFMPGRPLGPGDPIENSPAEARKVQKKSNHQLSRDLQIKPQQDFTSHMTRIFYSA